MPGVTPAPASIIINNSKPTPINSQLPEEPEPTDKPESTESNDQTKTTAISTPELSETSDVTSTASTVTSSANCPTSPLPDCNDKQQCAGGQDQVCSDEHYGGCECEVIAASGTAEAGFKHESTFSSDDASETSLASSISEQLFASSVIPELPALSDIIVGNGTSTIETLTSTTVRLPSSGVSKTSVTATSEPSLPSTISAEKPNPTTTITFDDTITSATLTTIATSSIAQSTTSYEPPITTTNSEMDPVPTGEPTICDFFSSLFKEKNCFFWICGSTSSDWWTGLRLRGQDEAIWEDENTNPADKNPWKFSKDSIGIQESMELSWDGEEASCRCTVNEEEIEGTVSEYIDGDSGFTYWSSEYVCNCGFECHASQ